MTTHETAHTSEHPHLLLVDDDETFCKVLAQALKKRQFEVFVAHDLETGMELAQKVEPEFAVIDLRIGHDSGLMMVKTLKELDDNTSIVMLTGFASVATAVEAIKLGATHYLTKPADTDEIVAALHKEEGDPNVEIKDKPLSVKRLEWEHLQKVLVEHEGNISAAARALGMHRRTLHPPQFRLPIGQLAARVYPPVPLRRQSGLFPFQPRQQQRRVIGLPDKDTGSIEPLIRHFRDQTPGPSQ